tara:strand:- start:24913 stop:25656 length:744 start_codon:yes stop_codon:yes gene_type:complete
MFKGLCLVFILSLTSISALASEKSICGANDDRIVSFENKIGRLYMDESHKGCTVTMISETCGISAGHCLPVLKYAEFNTPLSEEGQAQASDPRDMYPVIESSIKYQDEGPGKDWAVFKLGANSITGKLPGAVQGYHDVSFKRPSRGTTLRITGYGRDNDDPDKNFAQQTNTGKLKTVGSIFFGSTMLTHTVDTMGGNSGSTIINEKTQEVIGVHTHGGCAVDGGSNKGTLISAHAELKAAIRACLNN